MKKLFLILCSLSLLLLNAGAQTNTPPESPATFFATAQSWLTSVDTNYTFTGVTFEASTGYKQQVGINAANYITAQADFGRFNVGADFQFSGFGSAVNQIEGQAGYAVIDYYSVKLDADLGFGYSTVTDSAVIEPGLTLKKKLTVNTFAEIGVSLPQFFNQKEFNASPSFKFGAGFTF